jgi:DNA-binding NarL/FixJ family response regulator
MEIKLGLVEDSLTLREFYTDFFKRYTEFKVLFSVSDWRNLHPVNSELQPDIILLDIMLPSGNSLNYLHKIQQIFPYAQIIMLSNISDPVSAQKAFNNGAKGFLLKSSSMDFIKDALIKTYEGGTPLSPQIAHHLIASKNQHPTTIISDLTKKELELCNLIITGMSNKMVAAAMNISSLTVNQHLKHIYKKLNINSKSELVAHIMKL